MTTITLSKKNTVSTIFFKKSRFKILSLIKYKYNKNLNIRQNIEKNRAIAPGHRLNINIYLILNSKKHLLFTIHYSVNEQQQKDPTTHQNRIEEASLLA